MKYTKEYLEILVNSSKCMWDVLEKAEISKQQGNYFYLSKLINKYKIPTEHFEDQRKGQNRINKPLNEYLVKDKYLTLNGNGLKSKLYKAGLKTPFCELCGQGEEWRGKRMSLILDHINGDRENNELINLRIVCPNCNATLDTHCAKNRKNIAG